MAALRIHQHRVDGQRVALPLPPLPLRPARHIGAVARASASAPRSRPRARRRGCADSSASVANGISAERSIRGGRRAREPLLQPRAARVERQRAQILARRRTGCRTAGRAPGSPAASWPPTALRFSRCCRSANGATTPSRITSSSPSSTASEVHRLDDLGKGARRCPRRRASRAAAARRAPPAARGCRPTSIPRGTPAASSAARSGASSGCASIGGRNTGAPAGSGRVAAPLQPGEQRQVGRRQAVPHLLDLVRRDPPVGQFGQRDLGQPRRGADAQAAGDELQQRVAAGRVGRIQPAGDDAAAGRPSAWCSASPPPPSCAAAAALVGRAGHISATVSARSPT